jgi:S-adenosylmethionine decarboxylase
MFGEQFTILFEQCLEKRLLDDLNGLTNQMLTIAKNCDLHVVKTSSHKFTPIGVTVIMILSQSHLAIHTWPENQAMLVTLFVCQENFDLDRFIDNLSSLVASRKVELMTTFSK